MKTEYNLKTFAELTDFVADTLHISAVYASEILYRDILVDGDNADIEIPGYSTTKFWVPSKYSDLGGYIYSVDEFDEDSGDVNTVGYIF